MVQNAVNCCAMELSVYTDEKLGLGDITTIKIYRYFIKQVYSTSQKFGHTLSFSQIRAHVNPSQSSSSRHTSTSTVQRGLCESGHHGQIATKSLY